MIGQSERSHLKWVGVVGVCCGIALAIYRLAIYPMEVEDAVPPATAVVIYSMQDEDKDFSIIGRSAGEIAVLTQLDRDQSAILSIDSTWKDGLWMLQQVGTASYGWSVVRKGKMSALAQRVSAQVPASTYRGIPIFALPEGVWVARYRNLWLAGTQSRLTEAMIAALKDRQRRWQAPATTGATVELDNLSAFFSGMAAGGFAAWLQELETSELQLHLTALGRDRLQVRGRLYPWDWRDTVPGISYIAPYLPAQLAWCTTTPNEPLPEEDPLAPYLSPWLGTHKVIMQLALPGTSTNNRVVLLPVRAGTDPSGNISKLGSELGLLSEFPYQMFVVRQLLGDGLFSSFVSEGFQNPYVVILGDYVALSASRSGIEQVMNTRALGLSLLQDATFNDRIVLDSTKVPAAWWYSNHGRSARLAGQLLGATGARIDTLWSAWASSTAAIYQDGSISVAGQPRSNRSQRSAALVWQLPLEEDLITGPFIYRHRILTQEAGRGLVCRSLEGKIYWSYPLQDSISGTPQPLSLDGGQRGAFAFSAGDQVYVLDWQGKAHPPFPLVIPGGIAAPLRVSLLEDPVVYAFWVSSRDQRIYGYNQEGRFLTGWGPNTVVDTLVRFPVAHVQYEGKDYIAALSESGNLYLFDRLGRLRLDTLPLRAQAISPSYLMADQVQQRIAIGQSDGYVQVFNLEGQTFRLSLMPNHRGNVQFQFEDIAGDTRGDYLMWDTTVLRLFGYEGNDFMEIQSWSVGAPLHSVHTGKLEDETVLFGFSKVSRRIWAFSMNGEVLTGYPVAADTPPALWLEDDRLLMLCYYEGSLYQYEL